MQLDTEMAALRRLARALTSDTDAADDLVQDTLLAAIRHPPDASTSVRPWLATVLRRRRISQLRSAHREAARIAALPAAEATRSPEAAQMIRQLVDEMARLGDEDRQLLELRFVEGLSAVECAEVLAREPSTVRTQISRALQRLRARLDRRDGGRQAWMPALVAIGGGSDRIATAPLLFGPKALGLGAVLAGTTLWLGAVLPHGCGTTIETPPSEPSLRTRAEGAPATTRDTKPRASATQATFALGGPDPDDDDDVTKWGADPSQENAEGAVHPKLAVSMASRGLYDRVGRCGNGTPGSTRVRRFIRFDPDGSTSFERVEFTNTKDLDADELDCIRQTIIAREIQVRRVDVTMLGYPADTTVGYSTLVELQIAADGTTEVEGIEEQPRISIISTKLADELGAQLRSCGTDPVDVDVVFDPRTSALASAEAKGAHADDAQGRCVVALVEKYTTPTWRFEPRVPDDARLHCTFGPKGEFGPYTCKQAGPPATDVPRPIE